MQNRLRFPVHRLAVACLVFAFAVPSGSVRASLSGWGAAGWVQDSEVEEKTSQQETLLHSARKQRVRNTSRSRISLPSSRRESERSHFPRPHRTFGSSHCYPLRC
ncbi:MAG: hypothetical protein KatS3mg105_4014 [Gemmatales bacterium]|nr:MAG: hypothetical protein KatS3mg105_4014 [Gemmatales bacterium]